MNWKNEISDIAASRLPEILKIIHANMRQDCNECKFKTGCSRFEDWHGELPCDLIQSIFMELEGLQ